MSKSRRPATADDPVIHEAYFSLRRVIPTLSPPDLKRLQDRLTRRMEVLAAKERGEPAVVPFKPRKEAANV